ncbi:MAG TPA: hypothetical protein VD932_03185 [Aquabacterium sp.]|nr:hypothetical protein [Aquabacterium sp.]
MVGELRVYPPSSTSYWRTEALSLEIERAAGFPAQLSALVRSRWELHDDDDDSANPLQRGAYLEYWEGTTCLFRGKIKRVARTLAEGEPAVSITALDKLQVLNETYAIYDDGTTAHYAWSRQTPPLALSNVTLKAGHDYGDGLRYVWWPNTSSTAWLDGNTTTLGEAMASGASPASGSRLKMAQTHGGLPPAGFVVIGTEWIEYNGYAWDPADQYWYLHGIRRGALGSTAAAHLAGVTVTSKLSKRIDPRGRIKLEGDNAGSWELIQLRNNCQPQWESGAFAFNEDPLNLRADEVDYAAIRAGYSVFDEDGGGELLLSTLLRDVLSADPADGGPGFGGAFTDNATLGDMATLIDPDPVLTRVVVPKMTTCMAFIKGLLEEIGLARGEASDAVALYYDAAADEIGVRSVSQAVTADRSYFGEAQRLEEVSVEGLHSAVLVEYLQGQERNLVAPERCWHTAVGTGGAGGTAGGAVPYGYLKIGGVWKPAGGLTLLYPDAFNIQQNAVAGEPTNTLTDNDSTSGIALLWDAEQAAGTHFFAWFPGSSNTAPDSFFITKIVAVFDMEGAGAGVSGGAVNDVDFEFQVHESFTGSKTSSAPTAGTAKPLSNQAVVQYTGGTIAAGTLVTVQADNLWVPGRAVSLKINGYLDDPDCSLGGSGAGGANGGRYGFKLLELAVYGVQVRHELVHLTGTYNSADTKTLVYAAGASKLLDVHMGQFDVGRLSIGPATREVARNMGWIALLQSLAQSTSRTYVIGSAALDREGIAEVGETVSFSDGYSGVADSVTYSAAGGRRQLTIRAVDFRSAVTGGPDVTNSVLPPPRNPELRRSEEIRKAASGGRIFYTRLEG